MTEHKYATEEAINMQLKKYWIIQYDQLDKIKDEDYFEIDIPNNI